MFAAIMAGTVLLFLTVTVRRRVVKRFRTHEAPRNPNGRIWLDQDGIVDEPDDFGRDHYRFTDMLWVTETRTHVFIWTAPSRHLILPKRYPEVDGIVAVVREHLSRGNPSALSVR